MRILNAAVLALAGLFATTSVQAATLVSKPATSSVIELAQAKKDEKKKEVKKAAPKKAAAPKKKASGKKYCGKAMMYYDKKAKKCMSAADKK